MRSPNTFTSYVSKTGLLSLFDPEKERPIALIKVG
jgi:hypothetical protein